jgi:pyrimidine-specific ribonucleoside hydrolase
MRFLRLRFVSRGQGEGGQRGVDNMSTWRFARSAAVCLLIAVATCSEAGTRLIVDTDMGLDDARALVLLSQLPGVELLALVTSDGASSPLTGARNAAALMARLEQPDLAVGVGPTLDAPPPEWRAMSESLGWSGLAPRGSETVFEPAPAVLEAALRSASGKVGYLCLGPLTNLAALIRSRPELASKIDVVTYSGLPPGMEHPSWNTDRDPEAARAVVASGISLAAVQLLDHQYLRLDALLLKAIEQQETSAARLVVRLHREERVRELTEAGHFACWDETAVLSLVSPSPVVLAPVQGGGSISLVAKWHRLGGRVLYLNLLAGKVSEQVEPRAAVVLTHYPTEPELLREDVRPLAAEVVARYGIEEWKAVLLTNELHRHLGTYSLIGAKMGIRARELLGATVDELRVESHAGLEPPLSCLTDGLQVATGATMGRGTITVANQTTTPAAVFTKDERVLKLSLSETVAARVRDDIRTLGEKHDGLTPGYWSDVRSLSLRYWLELDRTEIFVQDGPEPKQE